VGASGSHGEAGHSVHQSQQHNPDGPRQPVLCGPRGSRARPLFPQILPRSSRSSFRICGYRGLKVSAVRYRSHRAAPQPRHVDFKQRYAAACEATAPQSEFGEACVCCTASGVPGRGRRRRRGHAVGHPKRPVKDECRVGACGRGNVRQVGEVDSEESGDSPRGLSHCGRADQQNERPEVA
jgi:hypothetical protein